MTARLSPGDARGLGLPRDAAFFARTDLETTAMLGYRPLNIDAVTTLMIGLLGGRPAVRHLSGATEEILRAMEEAGIAPDEETRTYRTGEEAEALAEQLLEEGRRFVCAYPLPAGRWPDAAHLVTAELWGELNAKDRLGALVPGEHLARRESLSFAEAEARGFDGPVWLKAGGQAATGWGFAVRPCMDAAAYAAGLREIAALPGATGVIVEDHVEVETCWCVNILVDGEGTRMAGSAEQVFASPGRQEGSLIDPENPFPAPEVAIAIGERARARGFRGPAGLDIGRARDGRIVVFDPNFRFNSSLPQVVWSPSASARSGLPVTLSADVQTPRPMAEVTRLIRGPVAEGWFVPTRLLDAALLPAAEGVSRVTGFTLGRDRTGAAAARARLRAILAPG